MPPQKNIIMDIYNLLYPHFNIKNWWTTDTAFEIILGAILTQHTSWKNVEKTLSKLKDEKLIDPYSLSITSSKKIESLIKSTGFYRTKTKRLKLISFILIKNYFGSTDRFLNRDTKIVRNNLIHINGIGPETADSILLYGGKHMVFPIDAYTTRIFKRFGINFTNYDNLKKYFEDHLPKNIKVYRNMHALIVSLGKTICKPKPLCNLCPLINDCKYGSNSYKT